MAASNDKVRQAQAATDEVVGIMHQNIEKVIQRGDKLDDLQDKTDQLQAQSQVFQKGATKLKKHMWWKNMKLNLIIAVVLAIILLIIVLSACFSGGTNRCGGAPSPTATPSPTGLRRSEASEMMMEPIAYIAEAAVRTGAAVAQNVVAVLAAAAQRAR